MSRAESLIRLAVEDRKDSRPAAKYQQDEPSLGMESPPRAWCAGNSGLARGVGPGPNYLRGGVWTALVSASATCRSEEETTQFTRLSVGAEQPSVAAVE